jgi:hypothetical protein
MVQLTSNSGIANVGLIFMTVVQCDFDTVLQVFHNIVQIENNTKVDIQKDN